MLVDSFESVYWSKFLATFLRPSLARPCFCRLSLARLTCSVQRASFFFLKCSLGSLPGMVADPCHHSGLAAIQFRRRAPLAPLLVSFVPRPSSSLASGSEATVALVDLASNPDADGHLSKHRAAVGELGAVPALRLGVDYHFLCSSCTPHSGRHFMLKVLFSAALSNSRFPLRH